MSWNLEDRQRAVFFLIACCAGLCITTEAAGQPSESPSVGSRAQLAAIPSEFWDSEQASLMGDLMAGVLASVPEEEQPEWLLMFVDILRGSQLGPNDGWFSKPTGGSRFDWEGVRAEFDHDQNESVTGDEWSGLPNDFTGLDQDGNGSITASDFDWSAHALSFSPGVGLYYIADPDSNGKVTRAEFNALFERIDDEELGFVSQNELVELLDSSMFDRMISSEGPKGSGPPPPPNGPSKATLIKGLFNQEIGALQPGPKVGDRAPDFTLETVEGDQEIQLSEYQSELGKPVVLILGNFTCGPFRSQAGNIEKLVERYRDRAGFLMVYIREAHPTDGWHMFDNYFRGYTFAQPTTFDRRVELARTCQQTLDFEIPILVDPLDDPIGSQYSGMPARLYLIDSDGVVAFKSGRGPFGFKVKELEQALVLLLQREAVDSDETPIGTDDPTANEEVDQPVAEPEG